MSGSLDSAAAPQEVKVLIRSTAPASSNGVLFMAQIEAPSLGLPRAYLLLDPMSNALALSSPCGCHIDLRLSDLLASLAAVKATRHAAEESDHLH